MLKQHKKLERLLLFSEVARHLSFTKASTILGISRGHLSTQIRQLEQEMNSKLLVRSTRSVKLTSAGQHLLTGMDDIRRKLLDIERMTEQDSHDLQGLIKITAPKQFTERYLLDICQQFKQIAPQVEFSINCSYTSFDLTQSDFDLAFRATNTPPENMIAKPLLDYHHVCVASEQYLLEHGVPNHPEELALHQCLAGQDQKLWQLGDHAVPIKGWLQVNDNHLLKSLALKGRGIIKVASYLVDQEIAAGQLVQVLPDFTSFENTIHIVHPQLVHQPRRLSEFIQFTQICFER